MIAGYVRRRIAAAGRSVAAFAAVFVSALAGACFLTAAAWTALADLLGPASASAAVGGILLTPAAALWLAHVFSGAKPPEPQASPPVSIGQVLLVFTLALKLGAFLSRLRPHTAAPASDPRP